MTTRLAVVVSHPIQYYAPWFAELAQMPSLELMVFYLWDFGIEQRLDRGFGQTLRWDLPLLDGYSSCLVPNHARDPGTHHFAGLHNPALVPQLLRWNPDAILLFGYAYRSHLQVLLDPRLWGIPVLFRGDSHNLARHASLMGWFSQKLRALLFQRFHAALAVGRANTIYLAANGFRPSQIFFAPHAIDIARFQLAAPTADLESCRWRFDLGIPADASVLLFVGKLEPKKRPLDLLAAFAALGHPTACLVYAGTGPLNGQLEVSAQQLAPGRIHFLGFQNQASMPTVYALGDVLVLPSYGNAETWGLCVNEAMAMARPAIVSNHVGCAPDLVIEGHTGWVFPAGNVTALTRCLAVALSDSDRLKLMGQQAFAHIQGYSYTETTAGLMRALDSLVAA